MLEVAYQRSLRLVGIEDGHTAVFALDSFTRDLEHEIRYEMVTKSVRCSCENFEYRKQQNTPTMDSPNYHICKHIRLWREWFQETIRRSEWEN